MKNKFFTLLLAMMASVGTMKAVVYSGSCGADGDNLLWSVDIDNEVLTITGTGAMADFESMSSPWSEYGHAVKSVIISEGVTSIGNHAFSPCYAMKSINIPNSVSTIGDFAFDGCRYLSSITLPNTINDIGVYTFSNCRSLTSMEIPNSVKRIRTYAFSKCTGITNLVIPESVTRIDGWSFSQCSSLTSVTLPASVAILGNNVFYECTSLTSFVNYATEPQAINLDFFAEVNLSAATLYVPAESLEAYKAADNWKDFGNILPIEETKDFITVAEALEIGQALANSAVTETEYVIRGYVSNIVTPFDEQYKNETFWITDVKGARTGDKTQAFEVYRGRPNTEKEIGLDALIQIQCKIRNYNGTIENNGVNVVFEVLEQGVVEIPDTITVAQALEIGSALESLAVTEKRYVIKGYVSNIIEPFDEQFKNETFWITDVKGARTGDKTQAFEIYRGKPNTEKEIGLDALIQIQCKIKNFKGIVENESANQSFEVLEQGQGVEDDTPTPCITASGTCGNNLKWELSCEGAITISGTGAMDEYPNGSDYPWYEYRNAIKSAITGDGVTNIGRRAFENCNYLSSVEMSNSITSIGGAAFSQCTSLTSIEIPNNVTSIGEDVFFYCTGLTSINVAEDNQYYCSLEGVLFNKDKTTLIQYPAGKTATSYNIPNSVTYIRVNAFCYCRHLTSVDIPNSVTHIGLQAFLGCTGLTSLTIPQSVTNIEEVAFYDCSGLASMVVASGNQIYDSRDNCNAIIKTATNTLIAGCKNTIIPNSVTSIGYCAFLYCTGLTSISIPSSVTSIENGAFSRCINLTSVINNATMPQSLAINVFNGLNFSACTLYVPAASVEAYKAADIWKDFGTILPIEDTKDYITIAEAIEIGMALDSMATSAETYTIEGYVINAAAFDPTYKNQSWYMADDVNATASDFQAYRCYPIYGEDTVAVVNGSRVRMTGKLQKYYSKANAVYTVEMKLVPATILALPQIDTITVAEALAIGKELEVGAYTSKQYAIRGYVSSINIPFDEQFGNQSFYIADDISSTANSNETGGFYIYRGKPVTGEAVKVGAFVEITAAIYNYRGLNIENYEQNIPVTILKEAPACVAVLGSCGDNLTWELSCEGVLTISGTGAMEDYEYNATPWASYSSSIESVIIGNGVTGIARNAFNSCTNLTTVTIPNSVTRIGSDAFSSCKALKAVYINDLTAWCYIHFEAYTSNPTSLAGNLYLNEVLLSNVVIPDNVTTIGDYVFDNCKCLISATIHGNVTGIGRSAFYGCTQLNAIEIPNSVTSIGYQAFFNCYGLSYVTIGNSVSIIENYAFACCKGLSSITVAEDNQHYCSVDGVLYNKDKTILIQYPGGKTASSYVIPNSVKTIGTYAFSTCDDLSSVEIPNSVTSIGNRAFVNCSSLTMVTNYSVTPQSITANEFYLMDLSACTLYVPAQSLAAYQAANGWKDFGTIIPMEEEPIETIEVDYNIVYLGHKDNELSRELVTLHLPVAPAIEGFTFLKWQVVAGDLEDAIFIQAVYTENEPQSAPAVYTNPANPTQKLIRNGNVYILTDGKVYTITGQTVR